MQDHILAATKAGILAAVGTERCSVYDDEGTLIADDAAVFVREGASDVLIGANVETQVYTGQTYPQGFDIGRHWAIVYKGVWYRVTRPPTSRNGLVTLSLRREGEDEQH